MSTLKDKFCMRLRTIRAERDLSQENLAEMLGMSHNGYAKIERGETDVNLTRLEEICRVLQVEVADMLQTTGQHVYYTNHGRTYAMNNQGTMNLASDESLVEALYKKVAILEQKIEENLKK